MRYQTSHHAPIGATGTRWKSMWTKIRNAVRCVAGGVSALSVEVSRAEAAAADYHRLKHMSDADLARRGVERRDIAGQIRKQWY